MLPKFPVDRVITEVALLSAMDYQTHTTEPSIFDCVNLVDLQCSLLQVIQSAISGKTYLHKAVKQEKGKEALKHNMIFGKRLFAIPFHNIAHEKSPVQSCVLNGDAFILPHNGNTKQAGKQEEVFVNKSIIFKIPLAILFGGGIILALEKKEC